MNKPKVFLSHITEESNLAIILQKHISHDFLTLVDVFVSSESKSIKVGDRWVDVIDNALQSAQVMLILCSQASIKRPWINFEAGAAWIKRIPIIPICHTNMRPSELPVPLNLFQATLVNERGLQDLYTLLANKLESAVPKGNFNQVVKEVKGFEQEYGEISVIVNALKSIVDLYPSLRQNLMDNNKPDSVYEFHIENYIFDKMQPHLQLLQEKKILQFIVDTHGITSDSSGSTIQLLSGRFLFSTAMRMIFHDFFQSKEK